MKNIIFSAFIVSLLISCQNQPEATATETSKKIKVYLLGTFHFAQTDSTYNVLDAKHQQSIEELCNIISRQKPDKVFIERQPEYEFKNKYDSLYKAYIKTNVLPYRNELFQVGFRVAKRLNHSKVYQCDHPGQYGRYYRAAIQYARANNQMGYINSTAKGTVIREDDLVNEDSLQKNSSLLTYMKWINSDAVMNSLHGNYVANDPQIGSKDFYNYDDDDTLIGAEITADWYRRNIMIYAKMISQLSYDETAIFLIIGGDHVPILAHLFESNPHFEVMKTSEWLQP